MEDQKPDGQGGPLDQATLLQVIATGTQAQNQTMLAVQVSEFETMLVLAPPLCRLHPPYPSTHRPLSRSPRLSSKAWPNGCCKHCQLCSRLMQIQPCSRAQVMVETMKPLIDNLQEERHEQRAITQQLIAETRQPIAMQPGQPARVDYEYKRNGTANAFMLFAPLEGWREVRNCPRIIAPNRVSLG